MATILIVDENALSRRFLSYVLGRSGHQLLEATNGAEGLHLADIQRPDVVIADIQMPNLDSDEFISRLGSVQAVSNAAIIFHTAAYHENQVRLMARKCGAQWVLPKPSAPAIILRTVREALSLHNGIGGRLNTCLQRLNPAARHASSPVGYKAGIGVGHEELQQKSLEHETQRLSQALSKAQTTTVRLNALNELGIKLAAERDPVRLLNIGCRTVRDICRAKYAAIGIFDERGEQLRYRASRGIDPGVWAADDMPLGALLRRRKPQRMSNPCGDPGLIGLPQSHPPVHSFLGVAVASQKRIFGWLYLANKSGAAEFSAIDERAAATVASQLAVGYENLLLYDEIQQQHAQLKLEAADRQKERDTLRRMLRVRTVMAECNHALVHASDESALLNEMCRAIVRAGGYLMAWIGYTSDQGDAFKVMAQAGMHDSFPGAFPVPESTPDGRFAPKEAEGMTSHHPWRVMAIARNPINAPEKQFEGAVNYDLVISLPLKDGDRRFGVLHIYEPDPDAFDAEQLAMLEGLAHDISYGVVSLRTKAAREQAEQALRVTEEKLSDILSSLDNVVWSADKNGFVYMNSIVEKIYGRPAEEFYRNKDLWFDVIHPEDRVSVRLAHGKLRKLASFTKEYRIIRPDGEVRWIEERARPVRDSYGNLLRVDGIALDISGRKAYEARIEYLAGHDALTQLANRNLLAGRIKQAMSHARRNNGKLALLFLDLDRFKDINDSLGHEIGDILLVEVAQRLKSLVREGDTVARQGGDEFILLLTDVERPHDVLSVAHKIFDAFSTSLRVKRHEFFVTISIGATLYPADGDDIHALLRNADTAMYRAKEEQGNSFSFYSRDMSVQALERAELEGALRRALERKEFQLFYQPKIETNSGRIIGAEALIRWNHPDKGLVSPTRFIPMAEEIGLIIPIGEWVLNTACAQNKAWQEAGLPPICISVNLSARQFTRDELVASVAATLNRLSLDAKHLELELTESLVMNSSEAFIAKLNALKNLGIRLAIDDFGTGYSSLSYLKRFPVHHLKIDQSFVRDIATDTDDAAITSTVISLGHSLNLKVIAEGVETPEQVAFLRDHNCDEMQGYFFSKPLPADEFAELLRHG